MNSIYLIHKKIQTRFFLFICVILSVIAILSFSPKSYANTDSISKAYTSNQKLLNGEVVSLVNSKTNQVTLSNYNNQTSIVGIVVNENQSLISINSSSSSVQVVTFGEVDVLVNNLNGFINPGDKIALSPINGVGMKANGTSQTIGIAESSFNNSSKFMPEIVKTTTGKTINTKVGYIKLLIMIGSSSGNTSLIQGVQNLAQNITGRPVSSTRLIVALVISALGIVSVVTLIYSGVDGTLISFGRNPLAKNNFFKVLRNISIICLLIIVLTFTLVYLILY